MSEKRFAIFSDNLNEVNDALRVLGYRGSSHIPDGATALVYTPEDPGQHFRWGAWSKDRYYAGGFTVRDLRTNRQIIIDGNPITLSAESFAALKEQLVDG